MIEVRIDIPALDRLVDALNSGLIAAKPVVAASKAPPEETPAKTRPKATVTSEPDPESNVAADAPTLADVTAAAKVLQTKNGRDALVALLKEHGASNISGLDAGAYEAFIRAAQDAVA